MDRASQRLNDGCLPGWDGLRDLRRGEGGEREGRGKGGRGGGREVRGKGGRVGGGGMEEGRERSREKWRKGWNIIRVQG